MKPPGRSEEWSGGSRPGELMYLLIGTIALLTAIFFICDDIKQGQEKIKFERAFQKTEEALNYVEHHVLTQKQKWRFDGFLKSKQSSAAQ